VIPPCDTCDYGHPPQLIPENIEAIELWLAVQTQWRAGGMGVIGLDYAEVRQWAWDMGIVMTAAMWSKIKVLERHELEAAHAENDRPGGKKASAGSQG